MALILMILVGRLLKWMWSHEDDMLLPQLYQENKIFTRELQAEIV